MWWRKKDFKIPKKRQIPGPGWHSTNPFEQTGRRDQLPLTKIFQASLESGRLPKDWLTPNVSPIYKGSQRVDPKNFRPVSLTSSCSKSMERIIKFALIRFADPQQLMSKSRNVFLHGRSCPTNLLNASEQWTRALDKKAGVDVIYFDFKKAFDCVPHLGCYTS